MKTALVLLAGAMFLSTAFANDPSFEERFKAKTGRYTPAEEARRERVARVEEARQVETASCERHSCCAGHKSVTGERETRLPDTVAEAWYRAKFGRTSPSKELRLNARRLKATDEVLVAKASTCEQGCCTHER
jgi:hypothetical protein